MCKETSPVTEPVKCERREILCRFHSVVYILPFIANSLLFHPQMASERFEIGFPSIGSLRFFTGISAMHLQQNVYSLIFIGTLFD